LQVTRLTLLYGVAALQKAHGGAQLSLSELQTLVGASARAAPQNENLAVSASR
jgi:hypothetical protein